jgi:hypothetical protein
VDREWQLDGYIVVGPIMQTDDVELWRARDRSSGTAVALRPLPIPAYDVSSVRRLVARLAGVPHVAPVQAVLEHAQATVVVHDLPSGGTLLGLLEIRRHLAPGEVVTIGVPLAEALAAAHDRGLAHGLLTAQCVVFTDDGRPALLWPGSDRFVDAAADVTALRQLLRSLLDRSDRSVLDEVLAADGDARRLARDLLDTCTAVPVRLRRPINRAAHRTSNSHRVPVGRRRKARHRLRRLVPTIGAALGLAAAVAGGVFWASAAGGHAPTVPGVSVPTQPSVAKPVDWRAVLHRLDERRDRAFLSPDAPSLRTVYAAGSKALAIDAAALRSLVASDLRARGLRLTLVAVTAVSVQPQHAILHVVDRLPAYDLVDAHGRVAAHRGERGLRGWRIELIRAGREWLIAAIRGA